MSEATEEYDRADRWRAFAIHLLTASGAFMAFLSLIAAAEQRWVAMFGWLGLALFVDAIDGPLARKVDVKGVLPHWSGDLLDSIIDYATYSLIPAVALYLSGMIGRPSSFVAAALIVISSAIYYADTRMKTKDNFFRGFPVAWNFVVFTLFAVQPPEWAAFALVVLCSAATFLPVKFVHPVRVKRLRPLTLAIVAVWSVLGLLVLVDNFEASALVRWGLVASGLYLLTIGGVLQALDRLRPHRRH
ncbi:phosphatidylcholine synthase [Jiella pacifica]|uniref:Phosphatidylcholine synthase n=1 Tax=Jiella pacifica TaxID=2696469 RepID=A0A6N9SZH7_9HYPH|nr:phosphatidylcholine/phosphatidylserine synthase [Jiella pacifica]NDW03119.1 phosphatidylcholine/phosphatidylserine synthase [Jiella pacifica]